MKVTITKINKTERTSARTGKPYISLGIQTQEHGAKWLSGFDGKDTRNWKVGDTVEIEVEQKGEYLNFTVPKSSPQTAVILTSELQEELNIIKTMCGRIIGLLDGTKDHSYEKYVL